MKKHLIKVAEPKRKEQIAILVWLGENCKYDTYEQLYKYRWPDDGQWHSAPNSEIAYVEFDNEIDAMAFKLIWG